jgi:spermidine synthase
MLNLARTDLATINDYSLHHPCTRVHIDDAWAFVERSERRATHYQLIVVDLTVPNDTIGAQFHSIEWYQRLKQLLGTHGVLAVNAASPLGTPEAYWSIYNSIRAAGLFTRPYRIALPSFRAMGYGDDWGFILASPTPITTHELDDSLPLAVPRTVLHDAAQLRQLFVFPADNALCRATAHPTRKGSGLLLHYLANGNDGKLHEQELWDGLAEEHDSAPLPEADDGRSSLPLELQQALATPVGSRADEETLFHRVLDLMPALRRFQTRDMIATFLADPGRFLAAIDLPGLVERLLQRAAELPRRMVEELRLLRQKLAEVVGDHAGLLRLGMRVVTIVALVVIVANLFYPDAIYGKGDSGSGASTGDTIVLSRTSTSTYDPTRVSPDYATGGGFRSSNYGRGSAVDETGSLYPPRRYRYYPRYYGRGGYSHYRTGGTPSEPPTEDETAYRLTPETDILSDGKVTIVLTETAYLLLDSEHTAVIDQQTGKPLLFLDREPAQLWRAAKEIERQQRGLEQTARAKQDWINWVNWLNFTPWHDGDERELNNIKATTEQLSKARESLGTVPEAAPPLPTPPVSGAFEVFSGVWMLPDGNALALRLAGGRLAFMDGKGIYNDQARTQALDEPYPEGFRTLMTGYLTQQVRDSVATMSRLKIELEDAKVELTALQSDKREYDALAVYTQPDEQVEYGTDEIPLSEARRRTDTDLERTQQRITLLEQQINNIPEEARIAQLLITNLKP